MEQISAAPESSRLEWLWWNGEHRHSPDCAYVMAGTLPDGRWFVQYTASGRWFAFDHESDALSVARHIATGWIAVPVSYAQPSPSQNRTGGRKVVTVR